MAPLIDQFAEAVTRELGDRLKLALRANLDASSLETLVSRTASLKKGDDNNSGENDDDSAGGSTSPLQLQNPQDPRQQQWTHPRRGSGGKFPSSDAESFSSPHTTVTRYHESAEVAAEMDEMRQTVANVVMRLSTLEGRQRALQGKMAKLDSAWGGDASQMSLAIAELQHVVASGGPHHAEFGSLRGQLIALAHSIDKLDKRTATVERRLSSSPQVDLNVATATATAKQRSASGASAASASSSGGGGGDKSSSASSLKPLHHHQTQHHLH